MKIVCRFGVLLSAGLLLACSSQDYRDPSLPPQKRAELLLKQMNVEEKVAQLYSTAEQTFIVDRGANIDSLKQKMPYGTGILYLNMYGDPQEYAQRANDYQRYFVEHTRLGIPALFGGEGLHGFMAQGATFFPQAIALGCTFDPDLAERVYAAVALEMRSRGVTQVLSPVVDVARDPRWGRTEECFSEDPYLVASMGLAAVRGFQGRTPDDLKTNRHLIATLKHFVGHGQPEGGRNIAPVACSSRDVREVHMYPFEVCVKEGNALSVMASYNDLEGVQNHANKWLLTDVLCHEWGFDGYITGDAGGVDELFMIHHLAADAKGAAKLAIEAGVDVELVRHINTFKNLTELVRSGEVAEKYLDRAVLRLLTQKFRAGIFEHPYVDTAQVVYRTDAHRALALEAARKAAVLLKNESGLLPLDSRKIKTLAVIGPNAAGVHLGGYSPDPHVGVSILDGIRDYAKGKFDVLYAEGCKITQQTPSFWGDNETPNTQADDRRLIAEAVRCAARADAVVLVLGDNVSTCREAWSEVHRGDRDNLDLLGLQNELVDKIVALHKPVVALVLGGRPLAICHLDEKVPAIFQGFYLGQEGGHAFADLLFGEVAPSGKLSISMPRNVGQLPVYYNHKPSLMRSYLWSETSPLYPFGHGLSYTDFEYADLKIDQTEIGVGDSLKVSCMLRNVGTREGTEVVQLYIRDTVSSVTRPVMELKDFKRADLLPGDSCRIEFVVTPEKLMMYDLDMNRRVEPGVFELMIGSSSQDIRQRTTFIVKDTEKKNKR